MKKLIIDRQRWLRGDLHNSSLLRSSDDKMCCIGFFAKQILKMSDNDIRDTGTLQSGQCDWETHPDMAALYDINDVTPETSLDAFPDEAREIAIAAIFAKHGVKVEFVDNSPCQHCGK
jgi:hypothetical protein